jgi:hypothetical protein
MVPTMPFLSMYSTLLFDSVQKIVFCYGHSGIIGVLGRLSSQHLFKRVRYLLGYTRKPALYFLSHIIIPAEFPGSSSNVFIHSKSHKVMRAQVDQEETYTRPNLKSHYAPSRVCDHKAPNHSPQSYSPYQIPAMAPQNSLSPTISKRVCLEDRVAVSG